MSSPVGNTTILPSGTLTVPSGFTVGTPPLPFGVTTVPPGVTIDWSLPDP